MLAMSNGCRFYMTFAPRAAREGVTWALATQFAADSCPPGTSP
jgi:hypothetical protein